MVVFQKSQKFVYDFNSRYNKKIPKDKKLSKIENFFNKL